MKRPVSVLEPSIRVKYGVSIRICLYCGVKGIEDERIIVSVSDHKRHDSTIVEVKNSTEINFVLLVALVIPFEFRNICEPLLIWLVCMEFTIEDIFSYILRIAGTPRATIGCVFDRRFNILSAADTKDPFVVGMDSMKTFQIITNTTVSLIRMIGMDLFY